MKDERPTLSAQNRDVLANFLAPLPQDAQDRVLTQLQNDFESSVSPEPPAVGSVAPAFDLTDWRGERFDLTQMKQTIVLSFYRGGWCSFCTTALKALQRRASAISQFGGQILAISPEPHEEARLTSIRNELGFPLLCDAGNQIADAYGLRFSLAPLLEPIYAEYEIEFAEERLDVPYPATFILDAKRQVRASFVNRDPGVRMEPEDIAAVVRDLHREADATQ